MVKVSIISKRCRVFFNCLVAVILLTSTVAWLIMDKSIASMWTDIPEVTITPVVKLLGLIATLVPLSLVIYGLTLIKKLLVNYENNRLFIDKNSLILRKIGILFFIWPLVQTAYSTVITLILTFKNKPNHRVLELTLDSNFILPFITGSIFILLSYVLFEAQKISEDNQLIP